MSEGQLVDVGGHRLRIRAVGQGPPDFLCLHGLLDTLEVWHKVEPALAERGRVILVDQRGHGESDTPAGPYSRRDLASDLTSLLDTLGVERAFLIGHSMGGIVAMSTALASPERVAGLVLLGTASECSERIAGWYEELARTGETEGLPGLASRVFGPKSRRQVQGNATGIAHLTRTLRSLWDDPLTPQLARIECPALVIVGEKDQMGPKASTQIAHALPDATLHVLPGIGHWSHLECPTDLIHLIDTWMENTQR